jgi:hypothetical protein
VLFEFQVVRLEKRGKMRRLITVISIIFFIVGCHGAIEITDYELRAPIYGSWIHKFTAHPSDGSMMIYNFLSSNRLEKKTYIQGHPIHRDTTHYFGSYQIPSHNLLYEYIEYQIESDTVIKQVNLRDTIVFEVDNEGLHLSFWGRTYKQIYGKPNHLVGGQFYDAMPTDTPGRYSYEMNHFLSDTVHNYAAINNSSSPTQIWEFYTRYSYTSVGRFLYMISPSMPGPVIRGHTFYKGDLILGYGYIMFTKYHGIKNQPN